MILQADLPLLKKAKIWITDGFWPVFFRKWPVEGLKQALSNLSEQEAQQLIEAFLGVGKDSPAKVAAKILSFGGAEQVDDGDDLDKAHAQAMTAVAYSRETLLFQIGGFLEVQAEVTGSDLSDLQVHVLGSSIKDGNFLVPVLYWGADGEARWQHWSQKLKRPEHFICQLLYQDLKNNTQLLVDPRAINPLAGMLVNAYFSPEVRDRWPGALFLDRATPDPYEKPGRRGPQFHGGVQALLFALSDEELLKTQLIKKMELLVDIAG